MPGKFNLGWGSGMPSEEGSARERGGGRAFQTKALPGAGEQSWGAEKKEDRGSVGGEALRGLAGSPGTVRPGEGFRPSRLCLGMCVRAPPPVCHHCHLWLLRCLPQHPPWRAFTWPRPCSLLHRGPTPPSTAAVRWGEAPLNFLLETRWSLLCLYKMSPPPFGF